MKSWEVREDLIKFMVDHYKPELQCEQSRGKCDFRLQSVDDKCPCQKIEKIKSILAEKRKLNKNEGL